MADWFVVNARDARWVWNEMGGYCNFEDGETRFEQIGINLNALHPGVPMAMYHEEPAQEDFLVLEGEALLIVEGEERPLKAWDFVHCPPHTNHMIVGAGDGPCTVLAVGAREHQAGRGWGGYPVDGVALRHGAGVEEETSDVQVAYKGFAASEPTRYRDGLLPW